MAYDTNLSKFGDLMAVTDFIESCKCHALIDYDGYGHPVKDGSEDPKIYIRPSKLHEIPKDATHIIWFNK